MNKKNIGEIRRRMNPDKNNIGRVCGCYVNEKREIISSFTASLPLLPQDESEKYLAIFRKTLSGSLGRNLIEVNFPNEQVSGGEDYKLLADLRQNALKDDTQVEAICKKIIDSVSYEESYLILLAQDIYDIGFKSKNDEAVADASENMFSYILCSVCPVKVTKSALSYVSQEKTFHSSQPDWVVSAPDFGFMFPAFEGKGANIHSAVFYAKDASADYSVLTDAVFHSDMPMPATAQKATFQSILSDALEDECRFEVVQGVREKICGIIAENKEIKDDDEIPVSKRIVTKVLKECGVSVPKVEAFESKFDSEFGVGRDLAPENIVNAKQFEIKTPDVQIRVNPEKGDIVDVRVIDGIKYVLVRAEEGVEVNGVFINIDRQPETASAAPQSTEAPSENPGSAEEQAETEADLF